MVTLELFGVPRLRAGTGRLTVEAADVGQALTELARACPSLDGTVIINRAVHPAYMLSLNGRRFVHDPGTPLHAGDSLWLLAADAGG